jgi:hypothetical protein
MHTKSLPLLACTIVITTLSSHVHAAGPSDETVSAWNEYLAATEARINRELTSVTDFLVADFSKERAATRSAIEANEIPIAKVTNPGATGRVAIPDGTVAHWRAAVLLPGATLDMLLYVLQHPDEHPVRQDDVVWMRVRQRRPNHLALSMRLRRHAIVTVTYDTEHQVSYRRMALNRAVSKSVSTKIVEVLDAGTTAERPAPPEQDRGLLWNMNSYWRYEQTPAGVIVELESVTLSRKIPLGLGRLVEPIVDRIARESMHRTLASMRTLYASRGAESRE